MTVGEQVKYMLVDRMRSVLVIVLTLAKQTLDTIENIVRVGLIESVMILIEFFLELFLLTVRNIFHIFLIKQGKFKYKSIENVPNISDSSALLDPPQKLQNVLQKDTIFDEMLRK